MPNTKVRRHYRVARKEAEQAIQSQPLLNKDNQKKFMLISILAGTLLFFHGFLAGYIIGRWDN